MADIPGFTPEESLIIQEAERVGVLTDEDQRLIMQRADEAIANPATKPQIPSFGFGGIPRDDQTDAEGLRRGVAQTGKAMLSKDVAVAGAGLAGGVLSAPGGPGAAIVGGSLAAGAASAAFDNLENAAKALGIVEGEQKGVGEISQSAIRETGLDASFGVAGNFIKPWRAVRRMQGFIYGVRSPEVKQLMDRAAKFGIDLSSVDVGGAFPKGFARVVGIFPITGTPLRNQFFRKQEGISQATLDIIDSMAPNASLNRDTGVNMHRAAEGFRKEFVKIVGENYNRFRDLANNASVKNFIPTDLIKEAGDAAAKEIDEMRIPLTPLEDGVEEAIENTNAARSFVAKLARLPEHISYKQYEGLIGELKDLVEQGKFNFDSQMALNAKLSLEQGLMDYARTGFDTVGMPEAERKAIAEALETAHNFYSKGIADFQSPTASKFTRVDKNLFRAGPKVPGSLNADELERVVVNLKSVESIQDLRKLVGDDLINEVAAKRLNTAMEVATTNVTISGKTIPIIDAEKFAKEMGIPLKGATSRMTKVNVEGLNELLRTSGTSVKDLGEFLEVLRAVEEIGDPSLFVARRVQIGGAKAAFAALGIGAAAGAADFAATGGFASAGAIATAVIARAGASSISNPKILKLLTKVMDPKVGGEQLRVAAIRLVNVTNEMLQGEEQPTQPRPAPPSLRQMPAPSSAPRSPSIADNPLFGARR